MVRRSLQGAVSQRNVKLTYRFESCPDYKTHITNKNVIYFEIANYKPT